MIYSQINKVTEQIISLELCNDQNFPSINQDTGGFEIIDISKKNRTTTSIFQKKIPYKEMYSYLSKHRIYNIKMIDGALIHFQYIFRNNMIERHRLTFFPSPSLELFQNYPELYLEDEIYNDILDYRVVTVPLRFDFDSREHVTEPILHPISHLTIGQYENCRIPVSAALTPLQFIKFILMNFYNNAYERYSDQLIENKDFFKTCILPEEKKFINLNLPIY